MDNRTENNRKIEAHVKARDLMRLIGFHEYAPGEFGFTDVELRELPGHQLDPMDKVWAFLSTPTAKLIIVGHMASQQRVEGRSSYNFNHVEKMETRAFDIYLAGGMKLRIYRQSYSHGVGFIIEALPNV